MQSDDPIRTRVLDALSLIASSDRMSAARPALPPGRVNFLLCEMWFNHVYVPGTRYMDGLKGDYDAEAARDFLGRFDEDEERWLERFNRFLELRVERLTSREREEGRFPPGERWTNITRDAGHLVALLGGNPREGAALDSALRTLIPE